jgi:hypothetical protein
MPEKAKKTWYACKSPWLDNYFEYKNWHAQTKIDIPGSIELVTDGDPSSTDLENSIKIYNALQGKLTEVQASDQRLWSYFCHDAFWDYMKWRWPPEKISTIETRYFVNGSSSRSLSRNGVARLWWFAHLTYDVARENPYELTSVFLQHQNVQHNLIERNFGRNRKILHATLDFIKSQPDINSKEEYERMGKLINRWGGVRLLDCLTKEEIIEYLGSKLTYLKKEVG